MSLWNLLSEQSEKRVEQQQKNEEQVDKLVESMKRNRWFRFFDFATVLPLFIFIILPSIALIKKSLEENDNTIDWYYLGIFLGVGLVFSFLVSLWIHWLFKPSKKDEEHTVISSVDEKREAEQKKQEKYESFCDSLWDFLKHPFQTERSEYPEVSPFQNFNAPLSSHQKRDILPATFRNLLLFAVKFSLSIFLLGNLSELLSPYVQSFLEKNFQNSELNGGVGRFLLFLAIVWVSFLFSKSSLKGIHFPFSAPSQKENDGEKE